MKRTPIARRTPLRAKGATLRRSPMKVKRKPAPPAAENRHLARVAELGCLVCGAQATVHHVTSDGYKRIARTDRRVVSLCPRHHQIQFGPRESVEALGHAGFHAVYGIDLYAEGDRLWAESEKLEAAR